MALFSMFKAPKNQQFDYKPRFWDPDKEDLEQRVNSAKGNDADAMKARISRGMRRGSSYGYSGVKNSAIKRSNIRLLMLVVMLGLGAYLFLGIYLPRIIEALGGNSSGY